MTNRFTKQPPVSQTTELPTCPTLNSICENRSQCLQAYLSRVTLNTVFEPNALETLGVFNIAACNLLDNLEGEYLSTRARLERLASASVAVQPAASKWSCNRTALKCCTNTKIFLY